MNFQNFCLNQCTLLHSKGSAVEKPLRYGYQLAHLLETSTPHLCTPFPITAVSLHADIVRTPVWASFNTILLLVPRATKTVWRAADHSTNSLNRSVNSHPKIGLALPSRNSA
jgi:hypothetical protein